MAVMFIPKVLIIIVLLSSVYVVAMLLVCCTFRYSLAGGFGLLFWLSDENITKVTNIANAVMIAMYLLVCFLFGISVHGFVVAFIKLYIVALR